MTSLPPPPFLPEYAERQWHQVASVYDRFWSKVAIGDETSCWPWQACVTTSAGYGRFGVCGTLPGSAVWNAHRVAYWLTFGPIEDLHVDHLCHSRTLDAECPPGPCAHRLCCNPLHLEAVTWHENTNLRREARKTRFKCGHPFEGNRVRNGAVGRCAECHRENERRARQKRRGGVA